MQTVYEAGVKFAMAQLSLQKLAGNTMINRPGAMGIGGIVPAKPPTAPTVATNLKTSPAPISNSGTVGGTGPKPGSNTAATQIKPPSTTAPTGAKSIAAPQSVTTKPSAASVGIPKAPSASDFGSAPTASEFGGGGKPF